MKNKNVKTETASLKSLERYASHRNLLIKPIQALKIFDNAGNSLGIIVPKGDKFTKKEFKQSLDAFLKIPIVI